MNGEGIGNLRTAAVIGKCLVNLLENSVKEKARVMENKIIFKTRDGGMVWPFVKNSVADE